MADPITSEPSRSSLDHFYHDNPTGLSLREVEDQQTVVGTLKHLGGHLADKVVEIASTEGGIHLAKKAAEVVELTNVANAIHLAHRCSLYLTAIVDGTLGAFVASVDLPASRGDDLDQARISDRARFAATMIISLADSSILPDGYVTEQKVRAVGTGELLVSVPMVLAQNILADIAKGDPHAIAFRDSAVASARAGVAICHTRHITSEDACEALRAANPEFRTRYDSDLGFQIGVRAGIWQAQVHPDEFDAAQRARGALLATVQLARSV